MGRNATSGGQPISETAAMPLLLPPASPCSFCEYLTGDRPYTILDRNEITAMLITYEQRGRGHILVVPVQHRETILDLSADERSAVMTDVVRATTAIVGAFDPEGVAVWQNNGIPAHQSVPHVHVHVAGTLPEGGTDWGDVARLTAVETDAIAGRLRPHLPM
jgi:histidine triad (HIT) family protein